MDKGLKSTRKTLSCRDTQGQHWPGSDDDEQSLMQWCWCSRRQNKGIELCQSGEFGSQLVWRRLFFSSLTSAEWPLLVVIKMWWPIKMEALRKIIKAIALFVSIPLQCLKSKCLKWQIWRVNTYVQYRRVGYIWVETKKLGLEGWWPRAHQSGHCDWSTEMLE